MLNPRDPFEPILPTLEDTQLLDAIIPPKAELTLTEKYFRSSLSMPTALTNKLLSQICTYFQVTVRLMSILSPTV